MGRKEKGRVTFAILALGGITKHGKMKDLEHVLIDGYVGHASG